MTLLYAKVTDTEKGLCIIGSGTDEEFYLKHGFAKQDVLQSDIDYNWYLADKCPMKTEEQKQKEKRERLDKLSLTRADVFEAFILAKGKSQADLRKMIEDRTDISEQEKMLYLNRFDNALEFYRGYPLFNLLCSDLDITAEQLDRFFETKDYKELGA